MRELGHQSQAHAQAGVMGIQLFPSLCPGPKDPLLHAV